MISLMRVTIRGELLARVHCNVTFHSMLRMKKMIIPLLFAACFIFSGCASERPRDIQTYNANLNRLKIGMTTKQVSALAGPPIRSEQAATAAGTIVEWYYVESQFMAMADAVVTGLQQYAGTRGGQRDIKVTFTNGRVSSIQSASATP
jgi:outer membrane protein assembly factor BamE (lipoprotein component of BamABCDE complex)